MSYLIGEMLMYLIGVALLGIIIGWLFTRTSYKRKIEDAEVVLLGQMHDVTKRLDIAQQQLEDKTESLEQERSREKGNLEELKRLQSELVEAKNQFEHRKEQVLELNQALDEANEQAQLAESRIDEQQQENQKMAAGLDIVKHRLTIFHSDLDDIVEQSNLLRSAFERARLELVEKDKRLAELESMSREGLQMAALSGNTEPELAISRIARLQTRVQELFDEVSQKDRELELLKTSITISSHRSDVTNISDLQADDLQQISGIGVVLEEKLNKMGVTRFSDIASWDDADIARIDQVLDFPGRIQRENWVSQAQVLGPDQQGPSTMRGH